MGIKLGLIGDSFSVKTGTGIGRYNKELLSGMTNKGLSVKKISRSPLNVPYGIALNHILFYPYLMFKHFNEVDVFHATSPTNAIFFPFIKKPCIVTYHDLTALICKDCGIKKHARIASPYIYKIAAKYSNKIIANSTQTKEELIKHLKIPESKISVINLAIDEKFGPSCSKNNSNNDCYTIGYIGALNKRKSIDFLIRAYYCMKKDYPFLKTKLFICGSKNLEYLSLKELAIQLGISNDVEFTGFIPDDKLVDTYNSFDIFVLPSKWEGFGLPILESQKCGVPVIIREDSLIPREVSKWCIKVKSEIDMANNIYELLTDSSMRSSVINNGLEYSKQFTWEKTINETLNLYELCFSEL